MLSGVLLLSDVPNWKLDVECTPVWLASRCWSYAADKRPSPGPDKPVVLYTTEEAWKFVGVTGRTLKRILGSRQPDAILSPSGTREPWPLWSEGLLRLIRQAIATGKIEVSFRSLTKPRFGARVVSARHRWAEDQNRETEQLQKACPLDFVIW